MRKPPLFLKKDFSIKYKVGKKSLGKGEAYFLLIFITVILGSSSLLWVM